MKSHPAQTQTTSSTSHYPFVTVLAGVILFVTMAAFPEPGICQGAGSTLKENTFHMAINRPEGEPYYTWIDLIYTEVFRRLDITLKIDDYPLRRASEEANSGRVDGEPARIQAYGAAYPNLIRVEEAVFPMTVAAYTATSSGSELKGWESLKETDYRVEYPRGMKMCENNLSKVVKAQRLSTITEASLGLKKLANKRIDLYVDDMNAVAPIMNDPEYALEGKVHLAGIMETVPLYMYVHKKHQPLVPTLAELIKAIKEEGLIEEYRKIAFGLSDANQ